MDRTELKKHVNQVVEEHQLAPQQFFLARLFDLRFDYDEGSCVASMPVHEFMYNPAGILHGGVMAFLADTAMGHLTNQGADRPYVSLEFKVSFMKAVKAGTLYAKAFYRRKGKKVAFLDCVVTNESGEEIAQMTSTYYQI